MQIIDNITTLLGDDLKKTLCPDSKLKIAASCFSIYAYEALKKELEQIDSLRFIFTSPTFISNQITDKLGKEKREFFIPKLQRENSLYGSEFELRLKNELTQRAIAKECAEWIKRKVKFRSNCANVPMQQFACIDDEQQKSVYMPLSGFTAVDLGYQRGNAVSNFVNKMDDPAFTSSYLNLFDQIWHDSEKVSDITAHVCEHIAAVYTENSPESVYFLILFNLFKEFLEDFTEDVMPNDLTGYQDSLIWKKLFNFQRDAAIGIINKLETFNGCILADSVGLGKTFTALAVVKYYELRNKSVLVLCPKKLADNWQNYNQNLVTNIFAKDRFNYDVLCHTDLQRTRGYSLGIRLDRINWGNYDLVVIDESHNFRNNDAYKDRETRYQKLMNKVIKEGVKTKVLMLSATPVNNRFNDLRNQLALAYEGDSENLDKKLRTDRDINEILRRAQGTFNEWAKLPPEERTPTAILNTLDFDFFEMLDSVTIARSRKHIQKFYDTKDIGPFPQRLKPVSYHSPLTHRTDVIGFNDIFNRLIALNMAVYAPFRYILASRLGKYEAMYDTQVKGGISRLKQSDREKSLQALMTVNLLKRLESSVEAFRLTLRMLQEKHETTLAKIQKFKQTGIEDSFDDVAAAFENADEDEMDLSGSGDDSIGGKVKISLTDMDLESWSFDLGNDLDILAELFGEMAKITPSDDAKLQTLKETIARKQREPINPGNKKIVIFTAFADTSGYLYNNLAPYIKEQFGLHTAKVTGSDSCKSTLRHNYDFQSLLTLFSPISKEKALLLPKEPAEIDILIGTDCISEGQNLQDCDYLINYDIHWNPVRIIQRFGRIDRIGSKNTCIQLVNFWPDISLDDYINLKNRVESRMVIADVAATGDDNVLSAEANDLAFRKEQLQRLQDEVIDLEDVKTGVSNTDLGLNDFRMDLVNYVKANGNLDKVPRGMHALIAADPEKGLLPGVVFVLKNTDDGVNINQQNRLLRAKGQLTHRGKAKAPRHSRPQPLEATAPNQIWSWDITYLATTVTGLYFYLYLIMDIFSRKIVGWEVYAEESAEHAASIFRKSYLREGIAGQSLVLHSDNGSPMKGATMLGTLQKLGVMPSFSRPSVSNDNPYSEALFKTLKYHPGFPDQPFDTLDQARQWVVGFAHWYNEEHRHSALKFVTPGQRHRGEDSAILMQRKVLYETAKAKRPERWSGSSRNWNRPAVIKLNPAKSRSDQVTETRKAA